MKTRLATDKPKYSGFFRVDYFNNTMKIWQTTTLFYDAEKHEWANYSTVTKDKFFWWDSELPEKERKEYEWACDYCQGKLILICDGPKCFHVQCDRCEQRSPMVDNIQFAYDHIGHMKEVEK